MKSGGRLSQTQTQPSPQLWPTHLSFNEIIRHRGPECGMGVFAIGGRGEKNNFLLVVSLYPHVNHIKGVPIASEVVSTTCEKLIASNK